MKFKFGAVLGMVMMGASLLWAQVPFRVEPLHANQDVFHWSSGGTTLFSERDFWSTQGLWVSLGWARRGGGTSSMSVYDLEKDLARKNNLLWLHDGIILRGRSKRNLDASQKEAIARRDKELNEAWKKRTEFVMSILHTSWWRGLPKAQQAKDIEKWWNDPNGLHKDPGEYDAAVGAVSPNLKYAYLQEVDELRSGWRGPNREGFHCPVEYVRLDLETGERTPIPITMAEGKTRCPVDISRDQRLLAVIGPGEVGVFLQEGYKPYRRWKYSATNELYFSPDSKRMVAIGDGPTVVWDIERDREIARIKASHWEVGFHPLSRRAAFPMDVFFSPDSRYLWLYRGRVTDLTPEETKEIDNRGNIIWDLEKRREMKRLPQERVERMEGWGPIPDTVFLGADDGLHLVDLVTGHTLAVLGLPPGSPPRRYRFLDPKGDPYDKPDVPQMFYPQFRAMCRSDGFVVGGYEGRLQMKDQTEPKVTLSLISWHLGPHLAEIQKRAEALRQGRK